VLPHQKVLQVPSLNPQLEGAAVQPLAHAFVKAPVAVAGFSVLELVEPIGPHRGEHERHDPGLVGVEAGIPL